MMKAVSKRILMMTALVPAIAFGGSARDDDYPHVPLLESGALLSLGHGTWDTSPQQGGSAAGSATSLGVALRAEGSLLGALLVFALPEQLRVGDFIGFDLGVTVNSFGVVARIVTGLQASYEVSHTVGVGVRAYYDTKWDPANGASGNSGGTQASVFYVEATGRYGRIIGRLRGTVHGATRSGFFQFTDAADRAFGLSVRVPVGRDNWMLALDYDHLSLASQGRAAGATDLARAGFLSVF